MEHNQVRVGDVELHVAELGSGPAVLFCHGFPDVWIGWRRQMGALADAGYRAVALDMRGYGRSSAPDDPLAYTPLHAIGDLVGLMDVLGLARAAIVWRSEERRVGKECVQPCRSRWSPYH